MLKNDHPYIRTYAFAALKHRKYDGLYHILLDNLSDKSKINFFTDDVGETIYVSDLMIGYLVESLSNEQKEELSSLIRTKFKHLQSKV